MTNPQPDNSSKPIMSSADQPPAGPEAPPVDPASFAPPETPKRRASDVLGALSTIEAQLAALKQVQNEQEEEVAKAQGELDQRQKQIEARAQELSAKEAAFEDREAKIKTATDELTRQRDAIAQEREAIQRAQDEANAARETIEKDRTALKEIEQSLSEREAEVGEAAKLHDQLEQASKRAEAVEQECEGLRKQCAELREERDEAMGVMERTASGVEQLRTQVEALTKERDEARAASDAASTATSSAQEEAGELRSRVEELTRQRDEARSNAGASTGLAEGLRADIERLEGDLTKAKHTIEELRAKPDAPAATGPTPEQIEQLVEERLSAARAEWDRDHANAGPTEPPGPTPEQIEQLVEERLSAARAEWDRDHANAEPAAPAGPTPEQIEQIVEERLSAARAEWEGEQKPTDDSAAQALIADLRAKIAKLESAPKPEAPEGAASPDTEALKQEVLKRDVAIKALRERLTGASERITQLESAAAPGDDEGSPMTGGGAMSGAATRAATAKAAEQVSTERTKLAKMSEALAEREQKLNKQAMRIESRAAWARASYTLLALLLSFAACAGGSWVGVGQFVKPEFNARAVIEADERERPLTDEDRASWQAFHEKLVLDPQLLDKVAERMRTRGVSELGSPSDLHELIESSMDVTSPEPGQLALSLRAEGGQRTERLLETFLSSLVSYSNSTRDLRKDRTATVVVTPATVENAPVTDPRMRLFLIVFGASSAVALMIVLGLSRSARRDDPFERETPIELESEQRVSVN